MRNKSFNEKQTEDLAHKIRFHEENRESGYLQDFCKGRQFQLSRMDRV